MEQLPDQSRAVHSLFTQTLSLDPSERTAFLRDRCGDDEALLSAVERLLGSVARVGAFLDAPILPPPAVDESKTIPDAVGNYLITRVLGSGGMATVYEAIQEQPRRRVALKVMRRTIIRRDAYLRFRFETEALARLQHPCIAQIYEAGTAHLGAENDPAVPFFAMELVRDARPITAYAELHNLTVAQRIEMLASVCDAVHHGHRQGIIHRDIKPGNVLVDDEGRVKVIDFGVARAIAGEDPSTADAPDHDLAVGTLNYMSPEQCTPGTEADTRSDVYSLGVLLHELVTSRVPRDLAALPTPVAIEAVRTTRPPPPGSRFGTRSRDLDAVIMKAMEKDPENRYRSAAALESDLRRLLSNRTVEARWPGVLAAVRLLAHRKPEATLAVVMVSAALVTLAVVSTVYAVRLALEVDARRSAEQQAILQRDAARWQAYAAQISGAFAAYESGEFEQIRTRLASAEAAYRGWEWGFLSRFAEQSEQAIEAHDAMIMSMAIDPDGTRIVTGAGDGTVRLWDADGLTRLASSHAAPGRRVVSAAFAGDGRSIAVGDDAGVVRLLHPETLEVLEERAFGTGNVSLAAVAGAGFVGATDAGDTIRWMPGDPAGRSLPDDQPGGMTGLVASADGSLIATFNKAGTIWIRRSGDLAPTHRLQIDGRVHLAAISPDHALLAAAGDGGRLLIWRLVDGELVHDMEMTGGINTLGSLAFSGDSRRLAVGLIHRGIVMVDTATGAHAREFGGHADAVSSVGFIQKGELLVSASWDRTVRVWRVDAAGPREGCVELDAHAGHVFDVAFSADGGLLVSVGLDGVAKVHQPDLNIVLATFRTPGAALDADICPDGRTLAVACRDGQVYTWDLRTAEPLGMPGGPPPSPSRPMERSSRRGVRTAPSSSGTQLPAPSWKRSTAIRAVLTTWHLTPPGACSRPRRATEASRSGPSPPRRPAGFRPATISMSSPWCSIPRRRSCTPAHATRPSACGMSGTAAKWTRSVGTASS